MPLATSYSHLQDVKSCDSTKDTLQSETRERPLFLLLKANFSYVSCRRNQIQPSQPPVEYWWVLSSVFLNKNKTDNEPSTCMRWEGLVGGRVGECCAWVDKPRGQDGCIGDVPGKHPPPRNKQFNQLQPMREGKQKTRRLVSETETNKSNNCFLQYFFFYSCSCFFFFFLLFYFFKTLKLESSVAPHTASFFRLAELYTLWNPAWMIQKNNSNTSNNENLLYVGGNFPWSFLLWSIGFLSF